jgi:hypothetical protein
MFLAGGSGIAGTEAAPYDRAAFSFTPRPRVVPRVTSPLEWLMQLDLLRVRTNASPSAGKHDARAKLERIHAVVDENSNVVRADTDAELVRQAQTHDLMHPQVD